MSLGLLLLMALYHMQRPIYSEILENPSSFNLNAITEPQNSLENNNNNNGLEESEQFEFQYPISSIGIDYSKNIVMVHFDKNRPKQHYNNKYQSDRHNSLDYNPMRFGKRQPEQSQSHDLFDTERSLVSGRDSRGDNFMRFGRTPKDFMRFGRSPKNDFMRFGRSAKDFMRFGRSQKEDFMRFGRPDNFMRFGRNPTEPSDKSANFMRFGKSTPNVNNKTNFTQQKNEIKEAAKQIKQEQEHQKGIDENNPMDRAIKVLFDKQQQQQQSDDAGNNGSDDLSVEQYIY